MKITHGPLPSGWASPLLSVLRIVAGFLFVAHGMQKLFGVPVPMPQGAVDHSSILAAAGLIETVGGVLLMIGLLTRPMAFIASGEMAVAYFTAHASRSFWPLVNGGELAVIYCFLFLYVAAAGPGPLS